MKMKMRMRMRMMMRMRMRIKAMRMGMGMRSMTRIRSHQCYAGYRAGRRGHLAVDVLAQHRWRREWSWSAALFRLPWDDAE